MSTAKTVNCDKTYTLGVASVVVSNMFYAILAMIGIVGITVLGDYFIKVSSELPTGVVSLAFVTGASLYAVSAFGLWLAMRHMSLASVGVFYAVLTILAMAALGVFVFGERLTSREIIGILLAFASLACMVRFA
ncbi:MAG: hypothetical protein AAF679_15125 [Pseudomonadota bacterium]